MDKAVILNKTMGIYKQIYCKFKIKNLVSLDKNCKFLAESIEIRGKNYKENLNFECDGKVVNRSVDTSKTNSEKVFRLFSKSFAWSRISFSTNCSLLSKRGTFTNQIRYCSNDLLSEENEEEDLENIRSAKQLLNDDQYYDFIQQYCSIPGAGHRVFVLQIASSKDSQRKAELQLAENIALVKSIPQWKVVESAIVTVKTDSIGMMLKAFDTVASKIQGTKEISAVFVSRNYLSVLQQKTAQGKWKLPVFDRSFVLTQVFKAHAHTKETKVQVALAELPHLKASYVYGLSLGQFGNAKRIKWPFLDRERKLKSAVESLKRQRMKLRAARSKRQIPTVSVIGYTNCGKTTLIKALTGDNDMIPQNRLFATLDVSAHAGLLPNHMSIVYMDTVGFISDLPLTLKGAFTSTLEDTISADLIIHVQDVSHLNWESQKLSVVNSIKKLVMNQKLDTIIDVCTKIDQLNESEKATVLGSPSAKTAFYISAVTGEGLAELREEIQARLLQNIGFIQKKLKIPLSGPHLDWLQREATVISTDIDDSPENLIVNINISEINYKKFLAKFGGRRER